MRILRLWPHLLLGALFLVFLLPQLFVLREAFWVEAPGLAPAGSDAGQPAAMVWGLLRNTLLLGLLTVSLSLCFGFLAAWCVTRLAFPARRLFSVLLCLPFAIPSYLLAGIALGAVDHPLLPSPASLWGAALVLSLTLYPWVYVPAKATLMRQSRQYQELACSLGLGFWQRCWRVHIWLLLPTAAVTALLVFMAVLNDFGTVQLLGVKTLSVGIHDAAFAMYRRDWAAQLALFGLALPVAAVLLFALGVGRMRSYNPSNRSGALPRIDPGPWGRWLTVVGLTLLLLPSLLVPLWLLAGWVWSLRERMRLDELSGQIWDTLLVTGLVTAITLLLALLLALVLRRDRALAWWRHGSVILNLNYAIPGVMLGIALLHSSSALPQGLVAALLSNSVGLVVLGGCLACLCLPFFCIRAGQAGIAGDVDDLGAALGLSRWQRLWRVELPLLRRFLACGALLVVVTMVKELPLSTTLQPFGFRSLAMRLHSFAGYGLLEESAIFALVTIALVAWPVVVLDRLVSGSADAAP